MPAQPMDQFRHLLAQVEEGMEVYDRSGKKVGKVRQCYLGGEDLADLGAGAVPPDSVLAEVPPALRSRLAYEGFVEIAPGLLGAHRYASGSQLAAVEGDQVQLSVEQGDLARK